MARSVPPYTRSTSRGAEGSSSWMSSPSNCASCEKVNIPVRDVWIVLRILFICRLQQKARVSPFYFSHINPIRSSVIPLSPAAPDTLRQEDKSNPPNKAHRWREPQSSSLSTVTRVRVREGAIAGLFSMSLRSNQRPCPHEPLSEPKRSRKARANMLHAQR